MPPGDAGVIEATGTVASSLLGWTVVWAPTAGDDRAADAPSSIVQVR
jgi:hypothetical protein